ncbi:MAG: hypothetical protein LC672_00725, partial [Acidobacteria bacterium]|nr:hypothetical protein [Acidobacteriota bacterium]
MKIKTPQRAAALLFALFLFAGLTAHAQSGSTRPRRVNSRQTARTEKTPAATDKAPDTLLDVEPANSGSSANRRRNTTAPAAAEDTPLLNPTAST